MSPISESAVRRPDRFNFATDVVDYWAAESPSLQAMLWVSQDGAQQKSMTFQHFSRQSHRLSVLLESLGARRGDVLMMILPRVPEWWEIATAGLRSGIIIAPATTLLTPKEIEYRCRKSGARIFVGDASSVRKLLTVRRNCPSLRTVIQVDGRAGAEVIDLAQALARIPSDAVHRSTPQCWNAPAILYFTSGTSGPPKIVVHNQVSYPLAHFLTGKHWLRLSPGKLCWNYTEQGWAKAAYSFFGAWTCGASLFVWDDRQGFNAQSLLDILHRFPITNLCAPPLAWRQMVLQPNQEYYRKHPPRALAHCTAAGEALNPSVIEQWRALSGLTIRDGYGQTEMILLCGNYDGLAVRPGSMGKPIPGVPLRVINSAGEETAPGEEGDIAILLDGGEAGKQGDSRASTFFGIFDGYVSDDGRVVRPEQRYTGRDGVTRTWYLTGDKATRDEDGYLWFVGRADDVINSSGYRIGPFEVESTLKQHPAVVESAVVSSPDPVRGEVVKAFVVLTAPYLGRNADQLKRELQEFCKQHAAPYKYPRKIEFVRAEFLPRTVSGKIRRAELRKMEWQRRENRSGGPRAAL
ncbi:hypothetical protein VTO42DRAFT_1939 [Malbranchea cinnamomea]